MIRRALAAAAMGLAATTAAADEIAPGFDCKKAASAVEKEICKDGYLTFRDGAMTRLYGALMRHLPAGERDALVRAQSDWLKARDRACGGPAVKDRSNCLFQRYERRIGRLAAMAAKAKLGAGPPLTGFYGRKMEKFNGSITVVEVPGEPVWVEISTVNGPTYHQCDLSTRAAARQGRRSPGPTRSSASAASRSPLQATASPRARPINAISITAARAARLPTSRTRRQGGRAGASCYDRLSTRLGSMNLILSLSKHDGKSRPAIC